MRPQTDRAQAAILRAVAAIAAPFGARVVIEELRARDWASLTLTGTRHELDVRLDGVVQPPRWPRWVNAWPTKPSALPGRSWPKPWWNPAPPMTRAWQ